jgi:hypothetical protein
VGEDVACVEGTCSRQTCCGSGAVDCEDDDPCTDDVCDDEEGCLHVDRCGPDGGVRDGGPSVEEDGGVVSHDGGTEDAGVPVPLDGGTTTEDGGTVAVDAGGPDGGRDAGTSTDAARPVDDAGVTLVDASSGVDAAPHADAATVPVRPDGGGRPDAAGPTSWDAGTNPSGGGDDDDGTRDGSCGCGTSGSKRWPVSVAVLALVAMATRRRRGASASAGP